MFNSYFFLYFYTVRRCARSLFFHIIFPVFESLEVVDVDVFFFGETNFTYKMFTGNRILFLFFISLHHHLFIINSEMEKYVSVFLFLWPLFFFWFKFASLRFLFPLHRPFGALFWAYERFHTCYSKKRSVFRQIEEKNNFGRRKRRLWSAVIDLNPPKIEKQHALIICSQSLSEKLTHFRVPRDRFRSLSIQHRPQFDSSRSIGLCVISIDCESKRWLRSFLSKWIQD